MVATDNLTSLHRHEEDIRAQSLQEIEAKADLSEHWNLIAEAINIIYAFTHNHAHDSDDELTIQYLGIRLFNAAGASIKLAMSGYYQKGFDQLRDVIETYFLVDYLSTYPAKIAEWKAADKRKRMAHFGAGKIRTALDKRDGFTGGKRGKIYSLMSEYASHASYPGITLTTTGPAMMAQVGPFFDNNKLAMWLCEMAIRVSHAAVILVNPQGNDLQLLATQQHYRYPTLGPRHRYSAVLFIEKEGFKPLFDAVNLCERYDIALASTKGMSVTASRELFERLDVPLLVLHDFDKSGFSIAGTLQRDTRRHAFEEAEEEARAMKPVPQLERRLRALLKAEPTLAWDAAIACMLV